MTAGGQDWRFYSIVKDLGRCERPIREGPRAQSAVRLWGRSAGFERRLRVEKENPYFSIQDGKKRFGSLRIVFMEMRAVTECPGRIA